MKQKKKIFFRKEAIKEIDKVFLISRHGLDYICKKYPFYKNKFHYSPLGIENENIKSKQSLGDVFRIVSCSFIRPEKRVDFIAKCIKQLSFISEKKIEWFHIGGNVISKKYDPLKSLKIMTANSLFKKIKIFFLGTLSNIKVFNFYKNQRLDLFLLLSKREGKPVSIMEALSVGLPIVATDVGGVSELIDQNKNGILIKSNNSSCNIAKIINSLIKNRKLLTSMRSASISKWKKVAKADVNFKRFAKKIYI
jgi:glycosyltransferase involved in cell wall biosynthesis